jgi:hypothetical protein
MPTAAEKVRAINAVLTLWQGEQAQFWSYTAALAALEIRLFSNRCPGNVHLICSPCVSIAGPVCWERCELTVVADETDGGLFLVHDRHAGMRVLCRQVQVLENVEPHWAPFRKEQDPDPAALLPGTVG